MRVALVVPILLLAACETPLQQCEARATRDLRTLDGLIAEAQATLQRGYGYSQESVVVNSLQPCSVGIGVGYGGWGYGYGGYGNAVGMTWCNQPEVIQKRTPVAVDLNAVRRQLSQMQAKRTETAREAARQLEACRASYPPQTPFGAPPPGQPAAKP